MKSQLFVLIVCLGAVIAQEDLVISSSKDSQILRILQDNSKSLDNLDKKVHSISHTQKGIETKLKTIGEEVLVISKVEDALKILEKLTEKNQEGIGGGVDTLENAITSAENRTASGINNLGKTQQEIKQVLIQVDAKQTQHERQLNLTAKSVHDHLTELDNVLKQGVLKELVTLGQTAKKLEVSQKQIEAKIGYLDQLAALTGFTANKVHLLEQGVRSMNISTQHQLLAITGIVHQVGTTTWHIDNKLGVLLSTQKNIERGLEECKKCHGNHSKDHYYGPKQPQEAYADHSYDYDYKDSDSSSSNAKESSYLYQLWYGKDHK